LDLKRPPSVYETQEKLRRRRVFYTPRTHVAWRALMASPIDTAFSPQKAFDIGCASGLNGSVLIA
jgi:hypothetical protein